MQPAIIFLVLKWMEHVLNNAMVVFVFSCKKIFLLFLLLFFFLNNY